MQRSRFWMEILAIGTAIACGLALLIASLGAAAASLGSGSTVYHHGVVGQTESGVKPTARASAADSRKSTMEGMLTCSRCGAKHSAELERSASDCARACVHAGARFALVQGDTVYTLDGDANTFKRLAARRVRVLGVINGNTIQVSSVSAMD
jgi:hypothetical protein